MTRGRGCSERALTVRLRRPRARLQTNPERILPWSQGETRHARHQPACRSRPRAPRDPRRTRPADRARRYRALLRGLAAALSRPHAAVVAPGDDGGGRGAGSLLRRAADRPRAAGRQHQHGRRRGAGGGWQRDRAQPRPAQPHPGGRSGGHDDDGRGRRHAQGGAGRGGGGGLPAAAVDLIRRHGADRRRACHQCGRQQHGALRQCARHGARARGRAAGRRDLERAPAPAQGQYRLRAAPAPRRLGGHARRDHRGGAQARAPPGRARGGALRRAVAGGGARSLHPLPARTIRPPCRPSNTCRAREWGSC